MFEWQPRRLVVQSDSGWAGDKSTRKSVSAGDQTVIAMSSGYAARQENMARELGVHLDAMELQVGANAAIGIIGKQGLGNLRHLDLRYLWLQSVVRGKQVNLKRVQSESNMADFGTKVLEKEKIDRHMKNLRCVRFDR